MRHSCYLTEYDMRVQRLRVERRVAQTSEALGSVACLHASVERGISLSVQFRTL